MYIHAHVPGQFHETDSVTKTYTTLGFANYVDLTYNVNIDSLGKESHTPCKEEHNVDFDDCLYKRVEEVLLDNFGCSVPFLPHNPDVPICVGKNEDDNKRLRNLYVTLMKLRQRKLCGLPCLHMTVTFGPMFSDDDRRGDPVWGNKSFIQIYLKSMVRKQEAVWDYPTITMLAEFAGYTGILFGFSVVDFSGFAQKLTENIVSICT